MLNVRARLVAWEMAILALLMTVTRFSHEGSAISLPDASLAVFFLVGMYCGGVGRFIVLFLLATLIDLVATGFMGISDYCLTPAYVFLLPTYGTMWWIGCWLRGSDSNALDAAWIMRACMAVVVGTSIAFLVSNLSFYAFSGKVSQVSVGNYLSALTGYYAAYLSSTVLYSALGVLCMEFTRSGLLRESNKLLH